MRRRDRDDRNAKGGNAWNQGFTLIELLIALLVFGIGAVALAQVLPGGMRTRDKGQRMTTATQFSRQQIETLRSLPMNHADLAAGDHVDNQVLSQGGYRRWWSVTEDVPLPGMKRLEVKVSFATAGSDSEAVIVTYLTR